MMIPRSSDALIVAGRTQKLDHQLALWLREAFEASESRTTKWFSSSNKTACRGLRSAGHSPWTSSHRYRRALAVRRVRLRLATKRGEA